MSKKSDMDGRRVLELLLDPALRSAEVAKRLGDSPEAVEEARCLAEEIESAEVDAILALPIQLGRALLRAAAQARRYDVLVEAAAEGEKEFQREARRIAHALKLRGVEVELPARREEEKRAPLETPAQSQEPPVLLSNLDSHGERVVFWTRNVPGRGIEFAQIFLSDSGGIFEFHCSELSRKRLRELMDELPAKGQLNIRPYDREEARVVVERARVAARDGGEAPASFASWAAQVFGPVPDEAPAPLAPRGEGRVPEDEGAIAALVADSASLFQEPELEGWLPEKETLRTFALRLEEARTSPLYLGGAEGELQREEAMEAVADREAATYFDGQRRSRYAAALLDTARLFELDGRTRQAQVAAATAEALAGDAPVDRIPFCRQHFARLLPGSGAAPDPQAQERQAPSLILRPDQL